MYTRHHFSDAKIGISKLAARVGFAVRDHRRRQFPIADGIRLQAMALLDNLGAELREQTTPMQGLIFSSSPEILRRVRPGMRGTDLHLELDIANGYHADSLGEAIAAHHMDDMASSELHVQHRAFAQARNAASHAKA